ncbi:MAG: DUF1428 domain-containing protein [Pseudomonadota bacterium]
MSYVDGYVIAVPEEKKADYVRLAELSAEVFKDHGALSIVENWADDVPDGVLTSFPLSVKCEKNESVVFSWITWPSREARDEGNKNAMSDPRFAEWSPESMPFDGKRMIYGGFSTIVSR